MWLKSCPRCSGDLFEERHLDGTDIACLQCSHRLNHAETLAMRGQKEGGTAATIRAA
ncbi:MAG: hypothetical protein HY329_02755 [Chloroflexi bacterium]|nr:hypothetical protein [Chloroflexota bacterium]